MQANGTSRQCPLAARRRPRFAARGGPETHFAAVRAAVILRLRFPATAQVRALGASVFDAASICSCSAYANCRPACACGRARVCFISYEYAMPTSMLLVLPAMRSHCRFSGLPCRSSVCHLPTSRTIHHSLSKFHAPRCRSLHCLDVDLSMASHLLLLLTPQSSPHRVVAAWGLCGACHICAYHSVALACDCSRPASPSRPGTACVASQAAQARCGRRQAFQLVQGIGSFARCCAASSANLVDGRGGCGA